MTETNIENSAIGYLMGAAEPTPGQWADQHRTRERSPEKRLLLAVLDDAIRCYVEYREGGESCRSKRLFDEAKRWIDGCSSSFFTFEYVCETLGISPKWLRRGLEAARASGMRKVAFREAPLRGPKSAIAA